MATWTSQWNQLWDKIPIAAERRKTAIMVASAAVIALGLSGWLLTRPQYTPVFTGLSAASAGQVTQELTALKIPWRLAHGGSTVEVLRSQADLARVELAAHNLPSSGQIGYQNLASLSSAGLTSQQFSLEQMGVLQQDLASTIETMTGVKAATVAISVPPQSIWAAPVQGASKASVYVDFSPGFTPSASEITGIMNLVAHAVPGLSAARVAVVNQAGQLLNPPKPPATNSAPGLVQLQDQMDAAAEANLERLLTPIVGPGNVTAVVHYQLSMQSTTSHQTLVQSSTPISVSKLTKKSTGTSGSLAVGTAGNTAPTYPATTGTSSSSVNKSSTQYVVGHVTTATTTPAGLVSTVTASVIVNQKALKLTRANIASIRSAVGMALGIAAKQQAADISVLSAPYAAVPVAPVSTTKLGRTRLLEMGAGAAVLALGIIFLLTRRRRRRPDAGVGVSGPLAPQYAPPAAAPDTVMESRVQTVVTKISRISQESPTEVADALTRLIGQDALRPADYDEREPLA